MELKSCPFCGSPAHLRTTHLEDYEGGEDIIEYTVCCDTCEVSPWVLSTDKQFAIDCWNTRAQEKTDEQMP